MHTVISFPGLGIGTYLIDPVACRLFDAVELRWYGLLITLGIILAFLYAAWRGKRNEQIGRGDVIDVGLVAVLCGIVGARAYYVWATWDTGAYERFFDVIAVWNGGMAIYGAIFGGCIGIIVTCLIKRLSWRRLFDMAAPGMLLAQAVGRWGDFINGEAHGTLIAERTVIDLFGAKLSVPSGKNTPFGVLRMGLEEYGLFSYYHPTFLYECVWNIIGFVILNVCYKRKKFHGQIALMYFAWYGLGRMLIEGFRTDSLFIPGTTLRVSQCVGLVCFVAATLVLVILCRKYAGNDPFAPPATPCPDDKPWQNKEDNALSRAFERVLSKRKNKQEENDNHGNKN